MTTTYLSHTLIIVPAGIFIYAYCFYYYYARSDMSGLMQNTFYFGYMAVVCLGFFLMLGYVGFRASLMFVRRIYRVSGLLAAFSVLGGCKRDCKGASTGN